MGRHHRLDDPESDRLDGRTTTGTHRAVPGATRRRIAAWPIACTALVGLLVLGVMGWSWANGTLNSRAEAQASRCVEGNTNVRVVVTPSAEQPVSSAATRWNQANKVVHGHCVHVAVDAISSQKVLDALAGRSSLDTIDGLPTAWIPESSWWTSELTTTKPALIGSPPQSVASARSADYPCLSLSGPGIDDVQQRAAQSFRAYLLEPAQQAAFAKAGLTAG
jgi:hypothetical protein